MDNRRCDTREGFGRRALLRAVLLVALTAGTLLLAATPGTTSAKDEFTYFAEAFNFVSSDSAGVETTVLVQAVDRPTRPDEVSLEVTRSDPACAGPDAGCPYVLLLGFVSVPVAEGEDSSGFCNAAASGMVTCGDEEFLDGQVDSSAEIARFILAD